MNLATRVSSNRRKANPQAPSSELPPLVPLAWHAEADFALKAGKPPLVMLVGEPAVGKSRKARQSALLATGQEPLMVRKRRRAGASNTVDLPATGREPLVVSGTPETEQSSFFGRFGLFGGETRFLEGPLPKALKSGRWLIVEEFSQIPLECRAALLPLRDQREIVNPLTHELLRVPSSFRLIATSNSESLCRKSGGIAKVLYDGFYIVECDEPTEAQVLDMLGHAVPDSSPERRRMALDLWREYRELTVKGSSGKSHLSYRAAEHLLRLLELGMNPIAATRVALVNKFLPIDPELHSAAKLKNTLSE